MVLPGEAGTSPRKRGSTRPPPAALNPRSGRSRTTSPGTHLMPSDRVREILPNDTAATWDTITQIVPPDAYLGGGTAIAVHLAHRISRDLDFFFHHESIDLDELTCRLKAVGPFAVTEALRGNPERCLLRHQGAVSARGRSPAPASPRTSRGSRRAAHRRDQRSPGHEAEGGWRSRRVARLLRPNDDRIADRPHRRRGSTGHCSSNASSPNTLSRPSTTSCSALATSTMLIPMMPCLCHGTGSSTTGPDGNPKSLQPVVGEAQPVVAASGAFAVGIAGQLASALTRMRGSTDKVR